MNCKDAGFSLIELIATIAVLAVVAAIGGPSMSDLLMQHRAASARYQITTSLASARIAAVTDGQPVSVCPIDSSPRCRSDGIWEKGWMTFRDGASKGQPTGPESILHIEQGLGSRLLLRTTPGRKLARFQPDGRSGGSTLTLSLCASRDKRPLGQVILSNVGRSRTVAQPKADSTCAKAN